MSVVKRSAAAVFGWHLDAFDWFVDRVAPIDPAVKRAAADWDERRLVEREADEEVTEPLCPHGSWHTAGDGRFFCIQCSAEVFPLHTVCMLPGALCPPDCDRTQGGCVTIWGPDADHREALERNALESSIARHPAGSRRAILAGMVADAAADDAYSIPHLNSFPSKASASAPPDTDADGPAPLLPPDTVGPVHSFRTSSTADLLRAASDVMQQYRLYDHAPLVREMRYRADKLDATRQHLNGVESGLDIGCRRAAEMFPQHKPKT